MSCVVCDFSNSKLKRKQYQQKISPKKYQTQIEILFGFWTTRPWRLISELGIDRAGSFFPGGRLVVGRLFSFSQTVARYDLNVCIT